MVAYLITKLTTQIHTQYNKKISNRVAKICKCIAKCKGHRHSIILGINFRNNIISCPIKKSKSPNGIIYTEK